MLSTVLVALLSGVLLAPAAQAAPLCQYKTVEGNVTSIDRNNDRDTQTEYATSFHWCWENGVVTTFIVDNVQAGPGVKVDIQPRFPIVPGGVRKANFPIYIHTTLGNRSDHKNLVLKAGGKTSNGTQ
jgi:hypothetical protein